MSISLNELGKKVNENSIMKKFLIILLMVILLLIPIAFWFGIINERESYKGSAIQNVASAWGDSQIFYAPTMSFEEKTDKNVNKVDLTLNNYNVDIKIITEVRQKGIFKIPVYTADVKLHGDFINDYGDISDNEITTSFEVKDSTGFIEEPKFKINNEHEVASQETKYKTKLVNAGKNIPFEITYKIRGLSELNVRLGGQINNVIISGNWSDPSFVGDFLPSKREITKGNFSGEWRVPKIATTSMPQLASINDKITEGVIDQVGVSLLMPVDNYRMSIRALKYSFLFITLTFLSYYIFELTDESKRRIHPLQYLLLGIAMLIFYLLLVSISEFAPFIAAYIIAAFMTISLISMYTYFVISRKQNIKFTMIISALLAVLYTFLYILLILQDLALLIGSFGLFLIVAIIMYVTRNIDWYNDYN